jgi:hypothetical protein
VNNIKISSVSRGENISKKTGQKSSKYGEFIKKPNFCGKARQRATQATPHPTASRIRRVYTWKEHDSRMRTRNPDVELVGTRRKGGGNNAKLNNSSTVQHFDAIFSNEDRYSLFSPYCVDKMFLSPLGVAGKQKPCPI